MTQDIDQSNLGAVGEQLAVEHLEREGYQIIKRNYRHPIGEIDIIALQDGVICFVEVKMRANTDQGHPIESITPLKQRKISRTALAYLQEQEATERPCRFDVVSILYEWGDYQIELCTNAFESVY